jgi:hypothetical protein
LRWLVLLLLVGAVALALSRSRAGRWGAGEDRPFALSAILFDIQVTLGIILFFANRGWTLGSFVGVVHPLVMLLAVVVYHLAIARARKQASTASYRTLALGAAVSLILVLAAIPWDR